jgi:hypothetical protein
MRIITATLFAVTLLTPVIVFAVDGDKAAYIGGTVQGLKGESGRKTEHER